MRSVKEDSRVLCGWLPQGSEVRLVEGYEGEEGTFAGARSLVRVEIEGSCPVLEAMLLLVGDEAGLLGVSHIRVEF